MTAVRVPAALRFLALIVPVALANAPVPPVTLPLVIAPVLKLAVSFPYRKPAAGSLLRTTLGGWVG